MAKLGLPVPPGFTISTIVCEYFYKDKKKIPKRVIQLAKKEIHVIEKISNVTKINKSLFKIKLVDKFPRNQSGKILYNKLN